MLLLSQLRSEVLRWGMRTSETDNKYSILFFDQSKYSVNKKSYLKTFTIRQNWLARSVCSQI